MGLAVEALAITDRERVELQAMTQAHSPPPRQWALSAGIVLLAPGALPIL